MLTQEELIWCKDVLKSHSLSDLSLIELLPSLSFLPTLCGRTTKVPKQSWLPLIKTSQVCPTRQNSLDVPSIKQIQQYADSLTLFRHRSRGRHSTLALPPDPIRLHPPYHIWIRHLHP